MGRFISESDTKEVEGLENLALSNLMFKDTPDPQQDVMGLNSGQNSSQRVGVLGEVRVEHVNIGNSQ